MLVKDSKGFSSCFDAALLTHRMMPCKFTNNITSDMESKKSNYRERTSLSKKDKQRMAGI
jgi:hypothetical protein